MATQNTLYIAEPLFSEKLQSYGADISFPPIKKIGITTDHPQRREKELLGTVSPVKLSIVKAWTNVDARAIEATLHGILDNSRLDGEYFWDGTETLVEAVTKFINQYHAEAEEVTIREDADVATATRAAEKKITERIQTEVLPLISEMQVDYSVVHNGTGVRVNLDEYFCVIAARTGSRYTFTIYSKSQSTEQALEDFPGSQELSATASDESYRRARIPLAKIEMIIESIEGYLKTSNSP